MLSAKEASKEQPFDSNAPWNADAVKFDTALERLGVEGQIRRKLVPRREKVPKRRK